ncbi:methyltransferase domain-containing protein [bacterium]|nr:methyltransferase domain-containing protein [bacterium]
MSSYDQQYKVETDLFGRPYPAFRRFIATLQGRGEALDLGCGQGRDTLMLAAQGYSVTGVDASQVGIQQMVEEATARGLSVTGLVDDVFSFEFQQQYDVIVLDSILHFAEHATEEIELLDRVLAHTRCGGYVFIFLHKSPAREHALHRYLATHMQNWELACIEDIRCLYDGKSSESYAAIERYMVVFRRVQP